MAEQTTAIAVTEKSVASFVMEALPNLQNYAIRKYNAQVWAKTAMLAIVENKDLMACLQTPAGKTSLYHALRFAAATGLSLNPQEGKAALVAIDGKVNYWPMKNGIVELVLASGRIRSVYGDAVRENDKFTVTKSFKGDQYEHTPALRDRGEITGFYSAILENNGTGHVYYMTREEIDEHKKRYGKGLGRPGSAWNTSYEGMGVKTAIKMGATRLDLPPKDRAVLDAAQDLEDDGNTIPGTFTEVTGVTAGEVETKLAAKKAAASAVAEDAQPEAQPAQAEAGSGAPAVASPAAADAGKGKGQLGIF